MGNTFSSSNALHIQPTKPFYYGGEVIEGVVALNCVTPMSSPLKLEVHVCFNLILQYYLVR